MLKLASGKWRLNQRSRRMPSSSSVTVKVRGSAIVARLAFVSPIVERAGLQLVDQPPCLGSFPQAFVTVARGAAVDPPALAGKAVRLAHDEHRELRLAALGAGFVDRSQHLAQRAHLGPGEFVAELVEELGVSDRFTRGCGGD